MARTKRHIRVKKTNPLWVVFCEGNSEKRYVSVLSKNFRVPIRIKSKLQKNSITTRKVLASIKEYDFNKATDTIVLFYDFDTEPMNRNLLAIQAQLETTGYKC